MKRMFILGSDAFLVNSMRFALRYASGISVFGVLDGEASVRQAIRDAEPDIVLVDGRTDDDRTAERLTEVRDERPAALIVVLLADTDSEALGAALEAGALVCLSSASVLPQLQALLSESPATGRAGAVALMANGAASASIADAEEEPTVAETCPLTNRELEILRAVAEGHTNARIGRDLWVTEQTVKFHLSNIYRKLGVSNRTEASRYALLNDLFATRRPAAAPMATPVLAGVAASGSVNGHRPLDPARR